MSCCVSLISKIKYPITKTKRVILIIIIGQKKRNDACKLVLVEFQSFIIIPSTNARVPSIFLPTCQKQKSVREILRWYVVVRSWWHKKVTSFTCLVKNVFFFFFTCFYLCFLYQNYIPAGQAWPDYCYNSEKNTFIIFVRVYLLFSACTRAELICM